MEELKKLVTQDYYVGEKFELCYKITDKDMKCKNFEYQENVINRHDGLVMVASSGFHAARSILTAMTYKQAQPEQRFWIVVCSGIINEDASHPENLACSRICFFKELKYDCHDAVQESLKYMTKDDKFGFITYVSRFPRIEHKCKIDGPRNKMKLRNGKSKIIGCGNCPFDTYNFFEGRRTVWIYSEYRNSPGLFRWTSWMRCDLPHPDLNQYVACAKEVKFYALDKDVISDNVWVPPYNHLDVERYTQLVCDFLFRKDNK